MLMLCISIRSSVFPSNSEKDRAKQKEERGGDEEIFRCENILAEFYGQR